MAAKRRVINQVRHRPVATKKIRSITSTIRRPYQYCKSKRAVMQEARLYPLLERNRITLGKPFSTCFRNLAMVAEGGAPHQGQIFSCDPMHCTRGVSVCKGKTIISGLVAMCDEMQKDIPVLLGQMMGSRMPKVAAELTALDVRNFKKPKGKRNPSTRSEA